MVKYIRDWCLFYYQIVEIELCRRVSGYLHVSHIQINWCNIQQHYKFWIVAKFSYHINCGLNEWICNDCIYIIKDSVHSAAISSLTY